MTDRLDEKVSPQVAARIHEIGRLAALPQSTMKLLSLLGSDNTTATQLRKVVERDPALSAKLISLANSAYYAPGVLITTIERAIMLIGFDELRFLVMGLGLADRFNLSLIPADYDGEALWLHSMAVAWITKEAAQVTGLASPGEAMLAGLLHNLGHITLVTNFTEQLRQILKLVKAGRSFRESEAELGLWHEGIGCLLARSWNMPQYLLEVILHHHKPETNATGQAMVDLVNLAVEMTELTDFRLDCESSGQPSAYWDILPQMDRTEKEKLLEKAEKNLSALAPAWREVINPSSRPGGRA